MERQPAPSPGLADVAVVGCGPVGAALAALLGRRGRSVVVLERHPTRYALPRAVHFDHEVARLLQGCGIGGALAEISEPGSEYEWRNGEGRVLLRFGGRAEGPSGWPDSNMFWQPAVEALLEEAAAAEPTVEIRRGAVVTDLDQHEDHVALRLADETSVLARYVVGCDGANSAVRQLVDAPITDLGFFYDWLIVDLALHDERVFTPVNVQVCDPARPTSLVSGGPGRRRWEFMRLPHESIEELDDERRAWELLAPWGVDPTCATLERHATYRFQARWAERWRTGRVLLAGDAAHQMPPFAGQGLCSGVRDAANLAWKLDLVLRDLAPDALLDTYQHERAENVRRVIDLSMELGRIICITDPAEAAERDQLMGLDPDPPARPVPPLPGIAHGIVRSGDALAGSLFVQGRVATPAGPMRLDDAIGAGWRLIAIDPTVLDEVEPAEADWFALLGGAAHAVVADDDVEGTYGTWFAEHQVVAALQRPDLHLFGVARSPAEVRLLLDDLRTTLAHPPVPSTPIPVSPGGPS